MFEFQWWILLSSIQYIVQWRAFLAVSPVPKLDDLLAYTAQPHSY